MSEFSRGRVDVSFRVLSFAASAISVAAFYFGGPVALIATLTAYCVGYLRGYGAALHYLRGYVAALHR